MPTPPWSDPRPIVLLEGCDKTGKTSVADELHKRLGYEIKKFSQPKRKPPVDEYFEAAVDEKTSFIADRFHLGEFVYGPIYRNAQPNPDRYRLLELLLMARGTVLVIMTDDALAVSARFRNFHEDFAQVAHVERILDGFTEMAAWTRLPLATFRLTKVFASKLELERSVQYIGKQVADLLSRTPALTVSTWRYDETIGNPLAPLLLVGEALNPRADRWQVPFCSTSGDYLMRALDLARMQRKVLLANSRLSDGRYYDRAHLERLIAERHRMGAIAPRVIALGVRAAENLKKHNVGVTAVVPHPQWWRRFKHRAIKEYAENLSRQLEGL